MAGPGQCHGNTKCDAEQEVRFCDEVIDASAQMPRSLKVLYLDANIQTSSDALAIALHALMLETGFIPKDTPVCNPIEYSPKWHDSGVYKIMYWHPTCLQIFCMMTCVPLNSLMAIFGTIEDENSSHIADCTKQQLSIKDFIQSKEGFLDPSRVYLGLKDLSLTFKDNFVYKLLATAQNELGIYPTFGLPGLMTELKLEILQYLPAQDLLAISATNKEFYELSNNNHFWKSLYWKDFRDAMPAITEENSNWKQLYKDEFVRRKRFREMCSQSTFIPPSFPGMYPPQIPNHSWPPPFLGGDYDRIPDLGIGIPPEVQSAFPHLRRRQGHPNSLLRIVPHPSQLPRIAMPRFF